MRKFRWIPLLLLLGALGLSDIPAAPNLMHFPKNQFSIAPLEDAAADQPYGLLKMYLPATSGGTAPSVTLEIQPFGQNIGDYLDLTKQHFSELGWTVIKADARDDHSAIFEFTGNQEPTMHFYARAEITRGHVYVVTGAASDTDWAAVSPELKSCVDSFNLDSDKPVHIAPATQP